MTGGSRGIGGAICRRLARQGLSIIINYHSNEKYALEVARDIRAQGGTAELLRFDVTSEESVDTAIESWEESHPSDRITVLVNNAGVREDSLLIFMQTGQWRKVIDTTLDGFFFVSRRILKGMLTKRSGRIINIASLSYSERIAGTGELFGGKGGTYRCHKSSCPGSRPRKVTVNAVAPGFIRSDMTKDLDEESLKKTVPLGRFGEADEVAALVAFLASDSAAYITGETISVNGGLY